MICGLWTLSASVRGINKMGFFYKAVHKENQKWWAKMLQGDCPGWSLLYLLNFSKVCEDLLLLLCVSKRWQQHLSQIKIFENISENLHLKYSRVSVFVPFGFTGVWLDRGRLLYVNIHWYVKGARADFIVSLDETAWRVEVDYWWRFQISDLSMYQINKIAKFKAVMFVHSTLYSAD